eukprot:ANDGO_04322.mRNA.1 Ubiquitin carboxyl-terminal hydrolase 22
MCKHLSVFLDSHQGRFVLDSCRDMLLSQATSCGSHASSSPSAFYEASRSRKHLCLSCATMLARPALQEHAMKSNHALALDSRTGEIYCFKCKDYVYESPFGSFQYSAPLLGLRGFINMGNTCFLNATVQALCAVPLMRNYFLSPFVVKPPPPLLQAAQNKVSTDRRQDSSAKAATSTATSTSASTSTITNRIGTTAASTAGSNVKGGAGGGTETANGHMQMSTLPVYDALHSVFASFFSSSVEPVAPHELMYAVWNSSAIRGYEQQDAHEFFMVLLNAVSQDHPSALRLFAGQLRSRLLCEGCGHVSTSLEPSLDLSLDIPSTRVQAASMQKRASGTESAGGGSKPGGGSNVVLITANGNNTVNGSSNGLPSASGIGDGNTTEHVSLIDCLDAFTKVERLEKISCSRCSKTCGATKRLSMQKLPQAICVHLKRFRHSMNNAQTLVSEKIDRYVSFPLKGLNLEPYVVLDVPRKNTPAGPFVERSFSLSEVIDPESLYDCVAVIQHKGSLESGHYTSFVRRGLDRWFHVDDDEVQEVAEDQVAAVTAYMLFYARRRTEYFEGHTAHDASVGMVRRSSFSVTMDEARLLAMPSFVPEDDMSLGKVLIEQRADANVGAVDMDADALSAPSGKRRKR